MAEHEPSTAVQAPLELNTQRLGRGWKLFPPLVIMVFFLIAGWQVVEYSNSIKEHQRRLTYRVQDLILSLRGVVDSQVTLRAIILRSRIEKVFQAFKRTNPRLHAIVLISKKGKVLASVSRTLVQSNWFTGDVEIMVEGEAKLVCSLPFEELSGKNRSFSQAKLPFVLDGRSKEQLLKLTASTLLSEGVFKDPLSGGELPRAAVARRVNALLRGNGVTAKRFKDNLLYRIVIIYSRHIEQEKAFNACGIRCFAVLMFMVTAWALIRSWLNLQTSAELTFRLVRAQEKSRYIEEMRLAAAGLAHETRNPLNVVSGIAQSIPDIAHDEKLLRERTQIIVQEVHRINARLSEFIAYSRPNEPKKTSFDLFEKAHDIKRLLAADADEEELNIEVEGNACLVLADESLLRQSLFNLVINAIEASPAGGRLVIAVGIQDGKGAWIEVRDQGPGVSTENQEKIFKPYITLNPSGTGLGLAVVSQVAGLHNWRLDYVDRSDWGAVFRIEGIELAI